MILGIPFLRRHCSAPCRAARSWRSSCCGSPLSPGCDDARPRPPFRPALQLPAAGQGRLAETLAASLGDRLAGLAPLKAWSDYDDGRAALDDEGDEPDLYTVADGVATLAIVVSWSTAAPGSTPSRVFAPMTDRDGAPRYRRRSPRDAGGARHRFAWRRGCRCARSRRRDRGARKSKACHRLRQLARGFRRLLARRRRQRDRLRDDGDGRLDRRRMAASRRSKAIAAQGVKPTLIACGRLQGRRQSDQALDAGARPASGQIDDVYDLFTASVGAFRPKLGQKGARATEAGLFMGGKAVSAGLADRVATSPFASSPPARRNGLLTSAKGPMSVSLHKAGEAHASSLIESGQVDRSSAWSFSAADGDKLLGPEATIGATSRISISASAMARTTRPRPAGPIPTARAARSIEAASSPRRAAPAARRIARGGSRGRRACLKRSTASPPATTPKPNPTTTRTRRRPQWLTIGPRGRKDQEVRDGDRRAHQAAILDCEEAKGRAKQARHIAFNTLMNADDARAIARARRRGDPVDWLAHGADAEPEDQRRIGAAAARRPGGDRRDVRRLRQEAQRQAARRQPDAWRPRSQHRAVPCSPFKPVASDEEPFP